MIERVPEDITAVLGLVLAGRTYVVLAMSVSRVRIAHKRPGRASAGLAAPRGPLVRRSGIEELTKGGCPSQQHLVL